MMEYETLVEKRQEGVLDDLQFLLAQEELGDLFLEEMKRRKEIPTAKKASKWLTEYEEKNLYNTQDDGSAQ